MRQYVIGVLIFALVGCGQSGPLYLPVAKDKKVDTEPRNHD